MSFLDKAEKLAIEARNSFGAMIDATKTNIGKTLLVGTALTAAVVAGIYGGTPGPNATDTLASFTPVELNKFVETNINSAIPESLKGKLEKIAIEGNVGKYQNISSNTMSADGKTCEVNLSGMDYAAFHNESSALTQKHMRNFMSISAAANCITNIVDDKNNPIDAVMANQKNDGSITQEDFEKRQKYLTDHAKHLASDIYAFSSLMKTMVLDSKSDSEREAGLEALDSLAVQHNAFRLKQFGAQMSPADTQDGMMHATRALLNLANDKHGSEKLKFILQDNERAYEFASKSAAGYLVRNYADLNRSYSMQKMFASDANVEFLNEVKESFDPVKTPEYKSASVIQIRISQEIKDTQYYLKVSQEPLVYNFSTVNRENERNLENSLTSWNIISQNSVGNVQSYRSADDFIKRMEINKPVDSSPKLNS